MRNFWARVVFVTFTAFIFYVTSWGAFAQRVPYRATDRQVENTLRALESDSDLFSRELEVALDRSSWNGTQTEDEIKNYVVDFEAATDRLKERFESRSSVSADVTEVFSRAANIDNFLRQYRFNSTVTNYWNRVRTNLNTLGRYYSVSYNPNQTYNRYPNNRYPNTGGGRYASLTGTYRLDTSRSTDLQREIDDATVGLNANQRDRVRRQAERRLTAPEEYAIERGGRTITIASTNSPRTTLVADGRAVTETNRNGRSVTITSQLVGEQLTINYAGDRANDFYVAFNPAGNELRVTRRIYLEGVNRQITAEDVYTRTSNVAQLDTVFQGRNNAGNNNNYPNNNGTFTVPNGTRIVAVLQNDLNTRQSQEGERFTMEVTSPSEYSGAIIEGRLGRVERSGRVSGRSQLELDFETIRLRNGQTYNFEGFVENVRTQNGDNVSINNEGSVREGDNQTTRTATRAGVGAAIGALIGAIAGGGQGAAVGAVVGAGAGAGSVILQGRDDLNLTAGTEVTISATAPRGVANSR
jgi:hypothetical protein